MAQRITQLHQGYRFLTPSNGRPPRPNVYRRSLEARENTNRYLQGVFEQAAGRTESEAHERIAHRLKLYKALTIGLAVLLLVAVAMYAGAQR